ncbi:uncharacterized protein [Arachis hypogaea]|uniref:EamA domain-containing protein n=1 Tax=Arachis hypogaea TaxID=3818 RepID=A0A445AB40_ARAHY|nr:uncharacterized protein LOC112736212 isoform X1 [Arachis hypogaea]RYR23619.1 hypothetical protein Ahy_B03g068816 [Arachis hypogaea]
MLVGERVSCERVLSMDAGSGGGYGYGWAVCAGFNAALAAISTKLPLPHQFLRYAFVALFNVTMWGCYVNSLKSLSSLQATVTNFATNFISSGLAGFFFFHESLSPQWFAGALLIIIGVVILSKSSVEEKLRTD